MSSAYDTVTPLDPPAPLPPGALAWRVHREGGPDYDEVGPWTDEPDKAQWVDPDTGLDCLVVRNYMGGLCGYVGVPADHPDFGVEYDDVDVSVHGGLTFAGRCWTPPGVDEGQPSAGVCHVPFEGRPHEVYWLGFDCGHYQDYQPGMGKHFSFMKREDTYRDLAYVVEEVTTLAAQLAER